MNKHAYIHIMYNIYNPPYSKHCDKKPDYFGQYASEGHKLQGEIVLFYFGFVKG